MDPQIKAIVAHITPIGWIIALLLNNDNPDSFTSFYIRQTLGLYLISILLGFIPFLGWVISSVLFIFWLMSLIAAATNKIQVLPLIGEYFQDWFRSL